MKKMLAVLVVVFLVGIFAVSAFAQVLNPYPAKMVFPGVGEFLKYVNFSFTVPMGNCGQFEVFEYSQAYPSVGIHAEWIKRSPEEVAGKGWYHFINNPTTCSQKVTIAGNLDFVEQSDSGWMNEVEPEEVGLFVKNGTGENNYFNLSTDDRRYSYFLLAPGEGVNYSLADFFNGYFSDNLRELVGVIVGDSRGFLKDIIWKKINRKGKTIIKNDIVFHSDEVIILIYKELTF